MDIAMLSPMVADIAHRAAKLNPGLMDRAALETEGVVLVDEIDLHLHPKWQRRVARDLQAAFPKMQFIATTHSPFIIQSLDPGEVIDLNQSPIESEIFTGEEQLAVPGPQHPFSNRSIEDITEEIMGVEVPQRSYRYKQMYDTAKEYYKLLEEAKHADNKVELETVKNKLDALSAPFSENVAYHAFLEMERIAAGLAVSQKKVTMKNATDKSSRSS
jgi:predicted ATP-binding protein involved in virulence